MKKEMSLVTKLTLTAILAAVSSVLMFFSVNVPFMPSFIKFDFSELPAMFASFLIGPFSGVVVVFIKNAVNLLTTTTAGVGELSNFLLGVAFVLPTGLIYKKWRTRKGAVAGAFAGAVLMAVLSVPSNFFIVYPVYYNFMPLEAILGLYNVINPFIGTEPTNENLLNALLIFNMPYTFIKGMFIVGITFLIYKPLSPIFRLKKLN